VCPGVHTWKNGAKRATGALWVGHGKRHWGEWSGECESLRECLRPCVWVHSGTRGGGCSGRVPHTRVVGPPLHQVPDVDDVGPRDVGHRRPVLTTGQYLWGNMVGARTGAGRGVGRARKGSFRMVCGTVGGSPPHPRGRYQEGVAGAALPFPIPNHNLSTLLVAPPGVGWVVPRPFHAVQRSPTTSTGA
jgi:hypothetical protein